jgi:hypothetical protein
MGIAALNPSYEPLPLPLPLLSLGFLSACLTSHSAVGDRLFWLL